MDQGCKWRGEVHDPRGGVRQGQDENPRGGTDKKARKTKVRELLLEDLYYIMVF